jgi:ATP-dependent helicase/nuclease subunit B
MKREFLGWDCMPLEAAAKWLIEEFDQPESRVLIALPGARSGRLLKERLAGEPGFRLNPPQIVSAGKLSDELLELEGRSASRLARTLAWAHALQHMDQGRLKHLVARPPAVDDLDGWWLLAEEVRGLFGNLAAEGKRFSEVAEDELLRDQVGERRRWEALAKAQGAMEKLLEDEDLRDPHLERWRTIREQRVAQVEQVVLIGVVEMNTLLRKALDITGATCTSLIFAPEELKDSFDEKGCIEPKAWASYDTSLDLERWSVVDRPRDQAEVACAEMAGWDGRYSANEITIGLANSELAPFVQRRLSEEKVRGRDGKGAALSTTGPMRLLEITGRFLRSRRFGDLADLVRHADLEQALRSQVEKVDPVATIDEYFNRHLPSLVDGEWLAVSSGGNAKRDRDLQGRVDALWQEVSKLLGELWGRTPRSIGSTIDALREFLGAVYSAPLDRALDSERSTLHALEHIGTALAEIEELPAAFDPGGSADQAIAFVTRALRSEFVPQAAARADEQTIEMLGWLELPLDNAPALVVVGFEDGHVPESERGDAFLPNRLRSSLGLDDDERRLARDLYTTELLLHSRDRVHFISGRRSLDGDPLLPSRIVYHCQPEKLVERVKTFLGGSTTSSTRIEGQSPGFELPRAENAHTLESISVTDFRSFLASPYDYYLTRVLRLKTLDDSAREMDPMAFGNVAHEVLERFGRERKLRDSSDEAAIAKFFSGELEDLAGELYGKHPLPAVRLQLRQLEYRLQHFATKQARRRQDGWRILEVEWAPKDKSVPFIVDGEAVQLRGRIDRIDHRPEKGEFAIWDYKTSENLTQPLAAHRKSDGTWVDLQLPLYCWLVAELCGETMPAEMGYAVLCRDMHKLGFHKVETWSRSKGEFEELEDGVAAAMEVAKDVVRRIRRQEFFVRDGFAPYDRVFAAIGGEGMIGAEYLGEDGAEGDE